MAAGELKDRLVDPRLIHIGQALLEGVVALNVVKTRRTGGHLDHDLSFAGGIHGQIAFGVIGAGYLGQKLFAERLVMKDALVEPVGICIDNHWLEPPFILLKTF